MTRITVQPGGPDRRVPVEKLRGTYFEQGAPREVHLTPYIARRLADGDLIEVKGPATPVATETPAPAPASATKGN